MRKRSGVKIRLLHRMKGSGKWDGKSNVLSEAHQREKVLGAVENGLENCADIKVDIEAWRV